MTDKLDLSIKLTECPICGEVLQATHVMNDYVNVDVASVLLTDDGRPFLSIDEETPRFEFQHIKTTIYCDNDHTEDQILAKLAELVS